MTENLWEKDPKNFLRSIKNIEHIILQFMVYSNLEDKVPFEASSIFNKADGA